MQQSESSNGTTKKNARTFGDNEQIQMGMVIQMDMVIQRCKPKWLIKEVRSETGNGVHGVLSRSDVVVVRCMG
jgi:hypothetical protein